MARMGTLKLIVCGSIAHDRNMRFPGKFAEVIDPAKLSSLSVSVLVDNVTDSWGGSGPNIASAAAQLGIERPVLYDAAGPDASDYLGRLASLGIDTSYMHVSKVPSASFSVLTDAVGNQFGGFYPGAMGDARSLTFEHWKADEIFACLSAHDPLAMRSQVAECRTRSIRMLYDPGQQVTNISGEDLRAGIAAAELVMVNDYEHAILLQKTGFSAQELANSVPILVVTHGKQGSTITGNRVNSRLVIAAAQPGNVVDPTGAGDSYRAGFLRGYLRQWDLEKCGKLASTVASFLVEHQASQCQLSLPAVTQRYRQTFNEEVTL